MKVLKEFKECIWCGKSNPLMGTIVKGEIDKGHMKLGSTGNISANIYCNIDPTKPPFPGSRLPGARVYEDVCAECGRVYAVKIESGLVSMPLNPGDQFGFV